MVRVPSGQVPPTGRAAAAAALGPAAARAPRLGPTSFSVEGLSAAERALATAVVRASLQRWLTLAHLLDRHLRQPLLRIEPALQGLLLTGAAQIVAMDRLPTHAVVDESVKLASVMVRRGARGLVNAVLRRVSEDVGAFLPDEPWEPAADRLPLAGGTRLLAGPFLPETDDLPRHLAVATSHPRQLVSRWIDRFGDAMAQEVCEHGVVTPPTVVAVEPGFDLSAPDNALAAHDEPGFVLWRSDRAALETFLAGHPARRVQDVASAAPVRATAHLHPRLILDYCAGRGTKTIQLAAEHPEAQIVATDASRERLSELRSRVAGRANIRALAIDELPEALPRGSADLVVVDVPCSNTGVLARRPEARYRFGGGTLGELVRLQRQIVDQALEWLAPRGDLLYCTCSLEPEENERQARWLGAERLNGEPVSEGLLTPTGGGQSYRDGSYHALFQRR